MITIDTLVESSYNLTNVSLANVNQVGAKAGAIGTLNAIGIRVPKGFMLPFYLFEQFMAKNEIDISQQRCFVEGDKIQSEIIAGEFSSEVLAELWGVYDTLSEGGKKMLVVRSSASVEDTSKQSMAGVFESILYINSFDKLKESVKKCYASIFKEKALHILFLQNIPMKKVRMGVIVQEFIEGQVSGIAFTADATSMSNDFVRVQAVHGICENFVSGKERYTDYQINKATLTKVTKSFEGTPILEEVMLNNIFNTALSIEIYFGGPQDIEWTVRDGELFILQSRPVTCIKYDNFPVTWDNKEDANRYWSKVYDYPIQPFLQEVYMEGGKYMAEGAFETLISLHSYGEMCKQNGYLFFTRKSTGMTAQEMNALRIKKINEIWEQFERGENSFHDIVLPRLLPILDEVKSLGNKDNLDEREVLRLVDIGLEYSKLTRQWHWPLRLAHECIDEFYRYCSTLKPDLRYEEYIDLLYQNSIFTTIREQCLQMADLVKASPEINELFYSCVYDEILLARLEANPEAESLVRLIKQFVDNYGLQIIEEKRILGPTISEQPHYVISLIRSSLHINAADFYQNREKMFKSKGKVTEELVSKLKEEDKAGFLLKLKTAEKYLLSVDNNNHYLVKLGFGPLRLALVTVGNWLRQQKLLKHSDDIYFLKYAELKEILNSRNASGFLNRIEARKVLFAKQKMMKLPDTIGKSVAKIQRRRFVIPKFWRKEEVVLKGLSGLAVKTNGIVYKGFQYSGIVRNEFLSKVSENSILVINYSHAGEDILPFLQKIRGVIYAWGSPYDHPGIMARELGIPVLYNVNINALQDGDEIELDGIAGQVRIIKRASKKR